MEQYAEVVLDLAGNAVQGASVQVLVGSVNGALATIYNASGTQVPNPISTGARGDFAFQAPNGKYALKVTVNGAQYATVGPLTFYDPLDDVDRVTEGSVNATVAAAVPGAVATVIGGSEGAGKVGYDGGTAQDVLDSAKPLADYAALRAYGGRATAVRITRTGLAGFFQRDDADTVGVDNGGTVIVAANGKRWKRLFDSVVWVSWFGAKGDGIADDTDALLKAKQWAITNLPCTLYFPKGVYRYSSLGNMAYSGLTIEGQGAGQVVLKCLAAGVAILIDAFASGSASAPFIQNHNWRNIIVEGNSGTTNLIEAHGLARCSWSNVRVRTASTTTGIGFFFKGVMLSRFEGLFCSTDIDAMSSVPAEGLRTDQGRRAGVSVGNSSDNQYIGCYFEGLQIGIRLTNADQNTFIGGSPESCSVYGLLVGAFSRYNTFINVGFENPAATADIGDGGIWTHYINIYASKVLLLQGRGAKVSGGYFERIEIQPGAAKNCIENVTINHWESGAGGFFDSGFATEWKNLWDADQGKFIYPLKDRVGISVTASPFVWANTTGQYVEVVMQTGVPTQVRILRGTDGWLNSTAVPSKHLLAPSDSIEVSYSQAVGMSYVPHNGFQG